MPSWLDWLNATAQASPPSAALTQSPVPPQRPAGMDFLAPTVPLPPSRPAGMDYPPGNVPLPPQRPEGAGIASRNGPAYGDPSVTMPSGLPTGGDPAQAQAPALASRMVPTPPARPNFATPQPHPALAQRRPADLPAPGAVPASGQAPQGASNPQTPQAPPGYHYVLQPLPEASQGGQGGAPASGPSGQPQAPQGLLNAFLGQGQPQGNAASVGATGPEIPKPTGLAGMLGAQPSMQAQNSTGMTGFLDGLFGFKG